MFPVKADSSDAGKQLLQHRLTFGKRPLMPLLAKSVKLNEDHFRTMLNINMTHIHVETGEETSSKETPDAVRGPFDPLKLGNKGGRYDRAARTESTETYQMYNRKGSILFYFHINGKI